MTRTRSIPFVAAALLALAAAPTSASAQLRATATGPTQVTFGAGRAEYRVHVTAGVRPERFSFEARVPYFGWGGRVEGMLMTPVTGPDGLRIDGPGALEQEDVIHGVVLCSTRRNRVHGLEPLRRITDVTLPAGAATDLVVALRTSGTPFWRTLVSGPRFVLGPPLTGVGTLTEEVVVAASSPVARGREGVRIAFTTSPATGRPGRRSAALAPGRRLRVRGTVEPRIAGLRITLRTLTERGERYRTVGTARTRAGGRWAATVRAPRAAGEHELWAFTAARGELAADHACPRTLTVRRSR